MFQISVKIQPPIFTSVLQKKKLSVQPCHSRSILFYHVYILHIHYSSLRNIYKSTLINAFNLKLITKEVFIKLYSTNTQIFNTRIFDMSDGDLENLATSLSQDYSQIYAPSLFMKFVI